MKVLITGGFGYIGGRLISYLNNRFPEIEVTVGEKVSCKIPPWSKKINYFSLELLSKKSVQECVDKTMPECVIHLAALNEIDCAKNPKLADKINRRGTEWLVNSAINNSVKKFIYFSTFHIYGKSTKGIITEKTEPKPISSYAITHFEAEKAVIEGGLKGMSPLIFRLSNSYGYPMDRNINRWTLLVNDLCRQAVFTGKMVLTSSGKQRRDFLCISSIVESVGYFLCDIPNQWGDGLYNLGSGESISVCDMACKVRNVYRKKYGKTAELVLMPRINKTDDNIFDFVYSVDKLNKTGCIFQCDTEKEIWKTMDVCEEIKRQNSLLT